MKMKKILIAAGLVLVSGSLLFAGCRDGRPCGGPGSDRGMFMDRIDREVADLKLTAEQQKKYDELRAAVRADRDAAVKEHDALEAAIRAELAKDSPDMAKVAELAKKFGDSRPVRMEKHIDQFLAFYNTLNDDQKKIAVKKMRDAGSRRGPRR